MSHWINLTDADRERAFRSLPDMLDGFLKTWGWLHFAKEIERICEEKNVGKIVLWQYRTWYGENTVQPGWSDWEEVVPRNYYTDTVENRVDEIQSYINQGYKYQLRALYAYDHIDTE